MPKGSASAIFEQRLTYLFMSEEQQVKRALATKSVEMNAEVDRIIAC